MKFEEMLEILQQEASGENLTTGKVPASMLYAFIGDQVIGRVSIRHTLNDSLLERGGHIGYWVAAKFRGLGYASEMFAQSLRHCRLELKMDKILVTCSEKNIPSIKLIEKQGGALENQVWDELEGVFVNRYWINLRGGSPPPE